MNISKAYKRLRIPPNVIYALVVVLILLSLVNIFTLFRTNTAMTSLGEENKPADIKITQLLYPDCEDCYDISQALDQIKDLNVKVTEERDLQWDSPEAQSLIGKYGIQTLPTIIITGETKKQSVESSWGKIGEMKDDGAVIFTKQKLPYYDVSRGEAVGLVTITSLIDSSCTQCIDMGGIVDAFREAGATISEEKTLEYDSPEAGELVEKFGIQRIPALIISRDITEYDAINQVWDQLDAKEKEGSYALHAVQPPYRNLETGEIEGLVEFVNLVDSSCSDCYDVSVHEQIVRQLGVWIANITTYDMNSTEGEALMDKYNITKVPIILLSPEASAYPSFNNVWPDVGTTESDGWHVFREISALGNVVYTDLG